MFHEERERKRKKETERCNGMGLSLVSERGRADRAQHNTPSWFGRSSDEELFGVASFFLSFLLLLLFFFFLTKNPLFNVSLFTGTQSITPLAHPTLPSFAF